MKKLIPLVVFAVFVVSWQTGTQYQAIPCVAAEPQGVVCAKLVATRAEKVFKTEDAAKEFSAVLGELKAEDLRTEKRDK